MKKSTKVSILIFASLLIMQVIAFAPAVYAAPVINFEIENVVWGTPDNYPITVSPGDVNVPLTIFVRNLSNDTLRGVRGTLNLTYPFKDYISDSYTAKATAQPVEQGDVLNQTGDILASGSFTLTFNLNIHSNATKGEYTYNLTLTYLVSQGGYFIYGEPRVYSITIRIYNRPPQIYSVNPADAVVNVLIGDSVNFTAKCGDPDNDSISYEWSFDDVTVGGNQSFYVYTPAPEDFGGHTLTLTVDDGNLTTSMSWTVNVQRYVNLTVIVSDYYITAGLPTILNFTITSNTWYGTVDVSYNVQNPLVIRGENSWTFENMTPEDTITVSVDIYAPVTVLGNTLPTSLTVSYSDEYGNTYTTTETISLIPRGYVKIIYFDIYTNPNPARSGQKVSISATLLNKGNVQAFFANVSLLPTEILTLTSTSYSYIGDLDENSPVPFTVEAIVNDDVTNGTYPVIINVYYEDDQFEAHEFNITLYLNVIKTTSTGEPSQSQPTIFDMLYEGGWTIIIAGVVIVVLIIFYNKRMSKKVEKIAETMG